jgi:hypothetical protein
LARIGEKRGVSTTGRDHTNRKEPTMSRIAYLAAAIAAVSVLGLATSAQARFGNQPMVTPTNTQPLFGNQVNRGTHTNTQPLFGNQVNKGMTTPTQPLFGNQINKGMTTNNQPLFGNQVNKNIHAPTHPLFGNQVRP